MILKTEINSYLEEKQALISAIASRKNRPTEELRKFFDKLNTPSKTF